MIYKPGDIVRCIDNRNTWKSLTIGKLYTVLNHYIDNDNEKNIRVIDDNGRGIGYYEKRFELAGPLTESQKLDNIQRNILEDL